MKYKCCQCHKLYDIVKNNWTGYNGITCEDCLLKELQRKKRRAYYQKNKDKFKKYNADYYSKNEKYFKQYFQQYYKDKK